MNYTIKAIPISERPRERLKKVGANNLSDKELLSIILKNGTKNKNVSDLSLEILNNYSLLELKDISIQKLTRIKGIGEVKAIQLLAVCELVKRINKPINKEEIKIKDAKDVAKLLMNEMRYEKREVVKLILLNNKNIVLKEKEENKEE